jgi:anthraniloyl-CoA monooxygenase
MKIHCVGGGPAGLYFAILMKKRDPASRVVVTERNGPDDTFGWGVVFSEATLGHLEEADPETYRDITRSFAKWNDLEIHFKGEVVKSGGHGFCGIGRKRFLNILQKRCAELGVELRYRTELPEPHTLRGEVDLLVAADGLNSFTRKGLAEFFRPHLDVRKSKYIWLGTRRSFDSFTFIVRENAHGLFQVHAYRFDAETSTFIVETDEASWRAAGLDKASTAESVAYCEKLFAPELGGHQLLVNKSAWINFTTVKNERWSHENVVLLGDAAHTAHFSIGSGTKLACEDAIALAQAFDRHAGDVPAALAAYETERRGAVDRLQKAAQDSLQFFEELKRYAKMEPQQLAFALLTRSKKVTHGNLKTRDPAYIDRLDHWFARQNRANPAGTVTPPMFQPFALRGLALANRAVVSPMCMYSAEDGTPNDWHLVHLGSRAVGGAGLVMGEATGVTSEGRITPGCTGMWKPEHRDAWKRVVDFVHGRTRAKIGLQLAHAGRKASTSRPWEGGGPLAAGAWPTLGPSAIPFGPGYPAPRAMTRTDLDALVAAFAHSTKLAEQAGFDLVELHAAHGYLLSSFLSPISNQRTDEYGGSLENRARLPLLVFDAMRAAWPKEKPISVRISSTDWVPGGFDGDQAVAFARMLKEHGADIVDCSSGGIVPDAKVPYGKGFQVQFADRVRNEAGIPTIAVGALRSGDEVSTVVASGRADLVAIAREHLVDPYLTLHAAVQAGYADQPWPEQYQLAKPKPQKG